MENKAIMFFDVNGYSEFNDKQLASFHNIIFPVLHRKMYDILCDYNKNHPEEEDVDYYINTWGDGIMALCNSSEVLLDVAMDFRDYFRQKKYNQIENLNKESLHARISLHWGQFLKTKDPFRNDVDGYYGQEIVRGARIEPVIPAGRVWCTDKIKEIAELRWKNNGGDPRFNFIDLGIQDLAKKYNSEHLWEVINLVENTPKVLRKNLSYIGSVEKNLKGGTKNENNYIQEEYNYLSEWDSIDLHKLETIIGDSIPNSFVCYKEIKDDHGLTCEFQPKILCLLAELLRSYEAAEELNKAGIKLEAIRESIELLNCLLKSEEPESIRHASIISIQLSSSIDALVTVIDRFKREYYNKSIKKRYKHYLPLRGLEKLPNSIDSLQKYLNGISPEATDEEVVKILKERKFKTEISSFLNAIRDVRLDKIAYKHKQLISDSISNIFYEKKNDNLHSISTEINRAINNDVSKYGVPKLWPNSKNIKISTIQCS